MNFRSFVPRALPSLSFASLSTKLQTVRVARALALGLCGTLTAGVADATRVHHYSPRHRAALHHALRTRATVSAGNASGALLAPANNLEAVYPAVSMGTIAATAAQPQGSARYELRLHHTHTNEDIDIVYRIGNEYIPGALAKLNYFLRDHRTMDASHYDPREFDLLHSVLASLGRPDAVIDIVCGYRTPWSNNFLRGRSASTGVAKNSQHIQAKAIDIRVPGVTTSHLRDVALSLRAGGVGYYPISQFVHVDVGPVRQWSFGGRGE